MVKEDISHSSGACMYVCMCIQSTTPLNGIVQRVQQLRVLSFIMNKFNTLVVTGIGIQWWFRVWRAARWGLSSDMVSALWHTISVHLVYNWVTKKNLQYQNMKLMREENIWYLYGWHWIGKISVKPAWLTIFFLVLIERNN